MMDAQVLATPLLLLFKVPVTLCPAARSSQVRSLPPGPGPRTTPVVRWHARKGESSIDGHVSLLPFPVPRAPLAVPPTQGWAPSPRALAACTAASEGSTRFACEGTQGGPRLMGAQAHAAEATRGHHRASEHVLRSRKVCLRWMAARQQIRGFGTMWGARTSDPQVLHGAARLSMKCRA